jgi:hypothetical protein
MDASVEQLLEVNDVGPIVAQSVHAFFRQPTTAKSSSSCAPRASPGPPSPALPAMPIARCSARPWC